MVFGLFNFSEDGTLTCDEAILTFRSVSIGLVKASGGVPPLDTDLEAMARAVSVSRLCACERYACRSMIISIQWTQLCDEDQTVVAP